jgi:hypothetical protein
MVTLFQHNNNTTHIHNQHYLARHDGAINSHCADSPTTTDWHKYIRDAAAAYLFHPELTQQRQCHATDPGSHSGKSTYHKPCQATQQEDHKLRDLWSSQRTLPPLLADPVDELCSKVSRNRLIR